MVSRRNLLVSGAAAGLGLLGAESTVAASAPAIERHVTLGKTGLVVSEIGFGSSSLHRPDLVRHAYERGVTFFDCAESYRFGESEKAMGKGLTGVRDKVVLTSKTKAQANDSVGDMMQALEGSLRRLQTDYVDIYFNHAVNKLDRVQNDAWAEFTERAKQQGKIRFRGVSGHASQLVPVLDYSIENDLVDVILCAYSFAKDPDMFDKLKQAFHFVAIQSGLPPVLEKARKKSIGVVAMKTLIGARLNDMRLFEQPNRTYAQSALRWVLSSPRVDAALISMTSTALIDEYVAASGQVDQVGGDVELLGRYLAMQSGQYCQPGCNGCESACPENLDIAEILRTRMYEVDYGNRDLALEDYSKLAVNASACLSCGHKACEGACPYGLPVPEFTIDAARRLG